MLPIGAESTVKRQVQSIYLAMCLLDLLFTLLGDAAYIDLAGIRFSAEPRLILSTLLLAYLVKIGLWSAGYWTLVWPLQRHADALQKGEATTAATVSMAKAAWRTAKIFPLILGAVWFGHYMVLTQIWLNFFPLRVPTTLSVEIGTVLFSVAVFTGSSTITNSMFKAMWAPVHNHLGAVLAESGVVFPPGRTSFSRSFVWLGLSLVFTPTLFFASGAYVRYKDASLTVVESALDAIVESPHLGAEHAGKYTNLATDASLSRVIVFRVDAHTVQGSHPHLDVVEKAVPGIRASLTSALATRKRGTLSHVPTRTLVKFGPVDSGEVVVAAVQLPNVVGRRFMFALIAFLVVILVWGPLTTFFSSRVITDPIRRTGSTIRRIASTGRLTEVVPDYRNDELGELFDEFRTLLRTQRHTEHLYRLLAENVSDVIWAADDAFRFSYVSPSITLLSGHDPGELRGTLFFDALSASTRGAIEAALMQEMKRAKAELQVVAPSPAFEAELRRKDGSTVWVEITARVIFEKEAMTPSVLGVTRDISARRKLEEQLAQSQKMEALGTLAGGVAHDFNNNLTVIISVAQLIQLSARDDQLVAYGKLIQDAGEKSAALTKQLLTFSRRQAVETKAVAFNQTILGLKEMLQRMLGEDIDLALILAEEPFVVMCDPTQIEQVIMNLAVNARDAMPRGGLLTIETSSYAVDESFPGSSPLRSGRHVLLSVSDNGIGMDKPTQGRIFEPFFTTKGKEHGTGLGLSTVYGIVKQMGGHIAVYSEPGVGSTFKIYLPLAASKDDVDHEQAAASTAGLANKTILLVEDEQLVRTAVRKMLEIEGFKVLEAPSGKVALDLYDQLRESIALVITDVVMRDMNGREIANAIWSRNRDARILFVSGYTENVMGRHGVIPDDIDFLQKPLRREDLLRKVSELIRATGGKGKKS